MISLNVSIGLSRIASYDVHIWMMGFVSSPTNGYLLADFFFSHKNTILLSSSLIEIFKMKFIRFSSSNKRSHFRCSATASRIPCSNVRFFANSDCWMCWSFFKSHSITKICKTKTGKTVDICQQRLKCCIKQRPKPKFVAVSMGVRAISPNTHQ